MNFLPNAIKSIFRYVKKISLSSLILWSLILYLIISRLPDIKESYSLEGQKISSLELIDLDGQIKRWPNEMPAPAILVFWASWCGPCKIELSRYNNAIRNNEISYDMFYAINIGEDISTIKNSLKEHNYHFQVLIDTNQQASHFFKVNSTPTVVHIDKNKNIEWVAAGISPTAIYRAINLEKSATTKKDSPGK